MYAAFLSFGGGNRSRKMIAEQENGKVPLKTVITKMPSGMVEALDKEAAKRIVGKRSHLIRQAVQEFLDRRTTVQSDAGTR
jgi:hypothetical protein